MGPYAGAAGNTRPGVQHQNRLPAESFFESQLSSAEKFLVTIIPSHVSCRKTIRAPVQCKVLSLNRSVHPCTGQMHLFIMDSFAFADTCSPPAQRKLRVRKK